MTKAAQYYVAAVVSPGVCTLLWAAFHWESTRPAHFSLYLLAAMVLGATRMRLPGMSATYSLSFLPVLYGLVQFSGPEVIIAAAVSAATGSLWHAKRPLHTNQVLFNIANLSLSAGTCVAAYDFLAQRVEYPPALLCAMAALYFAMNTFLVSVIVSLVERKPLAEVYESWYFWSFAYYLAGAAVLGMALAPLPWKEVWLVPIPAGYLIWFFWKIRTRARCSIGGTNRPGIPLAAQRYIHGVIAMGLVLGVLGLTRLASGDWMRFALCLLASVVASCFKVRLPGMAGTISTNFVLIVFAAAELGWGETLLIGAVAAIIQTYWSARTRPRPLQVSFNVSAVVLSATAAYGVCHELSTWLNAPAPLALTATAVYYACNTVLVSVVLGLIANKGLREVWEECRFWSLPYYLLGTVTTGMMVGISRAAGYRAAPLALSMMVLVFVAYRAHVRSAGADTAAVAAS